MVDPNLLVAVTVQSTVVRRLSVPTGPPENVCGLCLVVCVFPAINSDIPFTSN